MYFGALRNHSQKIQRHNGIQRNLSLLVNHESWLNNLFGNEPGVMFTNKSKILCKCTKKLKKNIYLYQK